MGWNHDPDAIHSHQSGEIQALTEKTTPVDADVVVIEDSEDSWAKKKVALSEIGTGGGGGAAYHETVGDTSETTFPITHNLGSTAVAVEVITVSTGDALVPGDDYTWTVVDADGIAVTFDSPPGTGDALIVVLASGGSSGGGGGWPETAFAPPATPDALDDEFTADTITSGPWTVVGPESGSWSYAVRNGWLDFSITIPSHRHAVFLLKEDTGLQVGDHFTLAHRSLGGATFAPQIGVCLADGTAGTSAAVATTYLTDNRAGGWKGQLQLMDNSFTTITNLRLFAPTLYQRITYQASNSFRTEWSFDGFRWSTHGRSDMSVTLSPTHVGFLIGGHSSLNYEAIGAIKFFRKNWEP